MTAYVSMVIGCNDGPRHPDYHTKKPVDVDENITAHFKEQPNSNELMIENQKTNTKFRHIMRPKDQLTLDEVCITLPNREYRCHKDGQIADAVFKQARPKNKDFLKAIYNFNKDKWLSAYQKTEKKE